MSGRDFEGARLCFARLKRLRPLKAPRSVIKMEQVLMVKRRFGLSRAQVDALIIKHVNP